MAKRKTRSSKVKRALKDKTKGRQSSQYDIHPKVLSSKIERREIDTSGLINGRVIAVEGRTYIVEPVGSGADTTIYKCFPSRSIMTQNVDASLLAVGDSVWIRTDDIVEETDNNEPIAIIVLVGERKSKLARRSAGRGDMEQVIGANVDRLLIVVSVDEPRYKKALIDRYLIAAEIGEIEPALCINKIDLGHEEQVLNDFSTYTGTLGIPVVCISATQKRNMHSLRELIADKTTVLSGPSGAGKSTIINALFGKDLQVTADKKKNIRKGQHITTFARMFRLPFGGYIMDTPGIREFAIWDITKEELALYFDEFTAYLENCKYPGCTHTHEPECAVKEALVSGGIDRERYKSYISLLDSLRI